MFRKIKLFLLLACCVSFWLLPGHGWCADTTTMQPAQKITISLTQYNQLKEIINEQETILETLQARLNVLKSNSTEQQQILIELQNQLQDCRSQLQTTQQNLTNAKSSLKQAEETLQRQSQSLQILTKKIKAMEHKQAVIKRQRDTWAIAVGVLFISYVAK